MSCVLIQEEIPRKDCIQKKKKAKNVAAKGSRIITSLFPPALTTSTLSSPDQLIEYKRKYLFMPIKTFSVAF